VEVVSIELLCTNRLLPSKLRVGDISVPTSSSPVFAKFRNITKPLPPVPPPLGSDIYWRLLSHLAMGYRSLGNTDTLRAALGLYGFRARVDRQAETALKQVLDGIKGVSTEPATRLFRGAPVRGVEVRIDMDEDSFSGEGDMFLLSTVLNELFALHVGMNAFTQLTVNGLKHGESYRWPPRMGERTIA
jgi:type VI secretion system protein ImpG